MSLPKICCTAPPVSSNYEPEGFEFNIGDLKVYETRDKTPKVLLICGYDIFEFHPNTKQFADKLNGLGFRVVMPDFFRGACISTENFPPKDISEIYKFVAERGTWDKTVKQDLLKVIEHYKKEGITTFGVYGFCWGAKLSIKAVGEVAEDVKAAAVIHPSLVEAVDYQDAKCPVLFLPTKDDTDMIPLYEYVKKKLGPEKTEHYRFEDVSHGFAGARGDWNDETQRKRVDESIAFVNAFFKKHLVE